MYIIISQPVHGTLTYPQGKKLNITLEENDDDEGEVTDEDEAEEIDQTHKVKPEEVIKTFVVFERVAFILGFLLILQFVDYLKHSLQ